MADNTHDKLEEALARLAAGLSMEKILTEAGDDAAWLHPLLEITFELGELKQAIPIPPAEASLQRLLSHGEELAAAPAKSAPWPGWLTMLLNLLSQGWRVRLAVGLAAGFLMVILLGGGLHLIAQDSLPNQALYSVKRIGEAIQLSLAWNSTQREQLLETFNQRRRLETRQLLEQGTQATVAFEGRIESLSATTLIVDGLTVQLTSETRIKGDLAPQAYIQLAGATRLSGNLIATAITVIETPPATPLPTITETPSPTATETPTTPPTPRPTSTLRPTATPMPAVTPTPTSPPTSTPTVIPATPGVQPTGTTAPGGEADPGSFDEADDSNDTNEDSNQGDNDNLEEDGDDEGSGEVDEAEIDEGDDEFDEGEAIDDIDEGQDDFEDEAENGGSPDDSDNDNDDDDDDGDDDYSYDPNDNSGDDDDGGDDDNDNSDGDDGGDDDDNSDDEGPGSDDYDDDDDDD